MPVSEEEPFWTVLASGTGPQAGLWWFTVEVHGAEKWQSESAWPEAPIEEAEFLYIELDPEAGKARSQLLASLHPYDVDDPRHIRRVKKASEGDRSVLSTNYFYEATTNVKSARRARAAIEMVVENVIEKWKRAPFASGEKRTIPFLERYKESEEFAQTVFDIAPGLYGVEP